MSHDILVAGEALVDFIPVRPGPISSVEGFRRRAGGAPANVAVALARLEHAPAFWTRVGDDPFGRFLRDTLAERGLPDRFLEMDQEAKTALAFVTHDDSGDRSFSFYRDDTADTRLEPGRIGDSTLEDLEWIHAGGVTLSSGRSREATFDLLDRGTKRGCTTSFDPNARPELWPDGRTFRRFVLDALADVDVLKATRAELEALGFDGESVASLARDALDAGPHTVFATRGSAGSVAVAVAAAESPWSKAKALHAGYEVDVVDATGAGDAFVAGAIAGMREDRNLEETLAFANAVGAAATTASGAMTALPDRSDLESMLE
ncbi:carbohydrate kinase family protein [Natrarchaeobius chitinivorans]|uniref:Carbohydrate kinase n=1 Tax=Natrarchaeobius chitinivorans TaxID=1679083 RepID=A0A3N6LTI5_NATCH|nr:carbohydrate kinase [Natrarchaeobius chitinivorans]RQG93373.1 carbohydrate kinase [Natrarchaeobius chitinivorans]